MKSWANATLDQVCSLVTDGTHHSPLNLPLGAYRYVTAKNIRPWGLDLSDITYVDEAIHQEIYARCPVEYGDVLYIKDGVTTGLAAINTLVEPFSMLSSVALLKPHRDVLHAPYLKHWLNSPLTKREMTSGMTGTAIKRLVLRQIRTAEIPLAPMSEQKRIADKLDTVLARVDAVSTRLDRVAPLLKRFRQSVLAAATSGRLTDDWRKNLGRLSATEGLPSQWQAASIATAAINQDNLRRPISEVERRERQGVFNYYGASGVIDTIDGFTHEGDFLLIGEDGANLLARSKPIAFRASGKIWVNNHAHVLTHPSVARLTYLSFAINAIDLSPWVTGSAQPKLTRKAMDLIPVPLPPEDEQTEIVHRVETLFAFADRLEARLKSAQAAAGRLTPALLAKAFRGELVPQDPNDEPASELLRRLQAASDHLAPARAAGRGRKRSI